MTLIFPEEDPTIILGLIDYEEEDIYLFPLKKECVAEKGEETNGE